MCVCVVVDYRECNGSLIMSTIEDGRKQFRGEECSSVALGIGPEKRGGSGEKQLKHCGHVWFEWTVKMTETSVWKNAGVLHDLYG